MLELVRKILLRYGYQVVPARDAGEAIAIEACHAGPIHLLLTDIVMPGLNGPDLAQRLVRRRPAMALLLMSGFAYHVASERGSISGRTHFLQKPFTGERLAATVRQCLDSDAAPGEAPVPGAAGA